MRICAKLIQKLQDDDYTSEYSEYAKDRVWFTDYEDKPGHSLYNSEIVWERYDEFYKKYPLVHKRVLKGEGPFGLDGRDELELKRIIAMNIGHINEDRARKLLFKIMEQNITGWWD
jgi:hypothetical protein